MYWTRRTHRSRAIKASVAVSTVFAASLIFPSHQVLAAGAAGPSDVGFADHLYDELTNDPTTNLPATLALEAAAGANVHRFTVSWPLIQPQPALPNPLSLSVLRLD